MGKRKRIVIIGAGFGGLYAAQALRKAEVHITLVDRTNHHLFQPLLYQVATAGLNPADIAIPVRRILRSQENVTVFMGEVLAIDVDARTVVMEDAEPLPYDFLIVATGATHSYFGHDEYAKIAPGLKTVDEALTIRQKIFLAYEAAEREADPEAIEGLLTFVVVGAGPTGVEMAGALSEIAKKTLENEFRRIHPGRARVLLIEGGDRVLGSYPEELSRKALAALEHLGVEVRLNARVTDVDEGGVKIGDERIFASTVIWAAGVSASPLGRSLKAPLDSAGRVKVTPELSIPDHDEVYVVGDLALFEQDGKPIPGVAPAAMQGAKHAAKNILATLAGEPRKPFHYVDKGSLATIGRASAVADAGFMRLSGFIAWLAWLAIHLIFLIGFKNRFFVLLQWAWSYISYDRGSRVIHGMRRTAIPSSRGFVKTGNDARPVETPLES
jgi:NADH:ubiquinone reductase (H+-translocating)